MYNFLLLNVLRSIISIKISIKKLLANAAWTSKVLSSFFEENPYSATIGVQGNLRQRGVAAVRPVGAGFCPSGGGVNCDGFAGVGRHTVPQNFLPRPRRRNN